MSEGPWSTAVRASLALTEHFMGSELSTDACHSVIWRAIAHSRSCTFTEALSSSGMPHLDSLERAGGAHSEC
eukprot:15472296-Alexandrium_andersonii.AAC.1